ncbi:alpha-ketoglutarate-dependent dioxygenase AlkB family protein [Shewanella sp.]|uniref:alpha-ketoglutarate-dependent dioxygenase AlkB family protein n=1 Tax=Shewanella sp. TaxID=50422 RepID=UPI003D106DD2
MHQQDLGFELPGTATTKPPISLIPGYLNQAQQQALMLEAEHYPFSRPEIAVYGRMHPIPRRQVWFGDDGCDYQYSGLFIRALPWPKYALRLRDKLAHDFGLISNGVLVNHYKDGADTMGWHSDDEAEIMPGSDIASITLGASRPFFLRHKQSKQKVELQLNSGDLLIMHWPMQASWQHSLPKRAGVTQPRLNLTYRHLIPHYHQG